MAYDELPESAIVFVCGYDSFGPGLPVYRIEPACEDVQDADMGAGRVSGEEPLGGRIKPVLICANFCGKIFWCWKFVTFHTHRNI